MRATIEIDDDLIAEAKRLTGIEEPSSLLHEGLRSLIAREVGRTLARLGGFEPTLRKIPRRRPAP